MATDRSPHRALWTRSFGRLFGIRVISQSSDGVFQIGLAAFVVFSPERAPTASAVAAAFATVLLPYSIVGPFAGVYLDRWPRHRVLVWANLIRTALVLVIAALVGTGHSGAEFFAVALLALGVNRFFLAALSAALPHTVTPAALVTANAVATTSGTIAAVVGAGAGVGIRALSGTDNGGVAVVLSAAAAGYSLAALVALTVPAGTLGPDAGPVATPLRAQLGTVTRGIAAGARHLWDRRPAAQALAAIAAHRFCYGVATVSTLLLYRNYFSSGDDLGLEGAAVVVGLSGVGVVVGAVITPAATRRFGAPRWIAALILAGALCQAGFGFAYSSPLLMIGSFFLGIVAQGVKVSVDTTVQREIDDEFRGRVFSFYDIVFNIAFVAAAAAAAATLPPSGKSYPVLAAIVVGYVLAGLIYLWRSAQVSRPSSVD